MSAFLPMAAWPRPKFAPIHSKSAMPIHAYWANKTRQNVNSVNLFPRKSARKPCSPGEVTVLKTVLKSALGVRAFRDVARSNHADMRHEQ